MAQQKGNSPQGNNTAQQREVILKAVEWHSKGYPFMEWNYLHNKNKNVHRVTIRPKGKCFFGLSVHGEEIWHNKRDIVHRATMGKAK